MKQALITNNSTNSSILVIENDYTAEQAQYQILLSKVNNIFNYPNYPCSVLAGSYLTDGNTQYTPTITQATIPPSGRYMVTVQMCFTFASGVTVSPVGWFGFIYPSFTVPQWNTLYEDAGTNTIICKGTFFVTYVSNGTNQFYFSTNFLTTPSNYINSSNGKTWAVIVYLGN